MFPVYAPGPILGQRPIEMVNFARRTEYLENGCARSINRGKAIHLIITLEQIRDDSAQMGPRVILTAAGVIDGNRRLALEAALSYVHVYAGSYCPLVSATMYRPSASKT